MPAGTVINDSTIVGTGASYSDGVVLQAGGTVANFGTILGTAGYNSLGVAIGGGGGVVTNGASGSSAALIVGSYAGVEAATVVNFGTIASVGTSRQGVFLDDNGTLVNYGTITGGKAVYTRGAISLTNALGG